MLALRIRSVLLVKLGWGRCELIVVPGLKRRIVGCKWLRLLRL